MDKTLDIFKVIVDKLKQIDSSELKNTVNLKQKFYFEFSDCKNLEFTVEMSTDYYMEREGITVIKIKYWIDGSMFILTYDHPHDYIVSTINSGGYSKGDIQIIKNIPSLLTEESFFQQSTLYDLSAYDINDIIYVNNIFNQVIDKCEVIFNERCST